MNNKTKVKALTPSQIQALEDTERHGNPWARVHGQSQYGGWHGVMFVLNRNKWIALDEKSGKYKLTDAGRKALRESD
jgi:hypothetical protein